MTPDLPPFNRYRVLASPPPLSFLPPSPGATVYVLLDSPPVLFPNTEAVAALAIVGPGWHKRFVMLHLGTFSARKSREIDKEDVKCFIVLLGMGLPPPLFEGGGNPPPRMNRSIAEVGSMDRTCISLDSSDRCAGGKVRICSHSRTEVSGMYQLYLLITDTKSASRALSEQFFFRALLKY
jgi:hypothetical protein